jgi:hypothetical protein
MNRTYLLLAVLACLLAGCKKDDAPAGPDVVVFDGASNIPVIANAPNAFAFTLAAHSYTATVEYDLAFTTDTLSYSMTIMGQSAGTGSLRVTDASSAIVCADSSLKNTIAAFTQNGKGVPRKIKLSFTGYSGSISFALARGH